MRLTKAAEYAIRCVLYLSNQNNEKIVPRNEIAEAMEIPRDFLTKISQQLSRAEIIEIIQGVKGGYRLQASPDTLNLLDVIEAMIGDVFLNKCALRPESCSESSNCSVHRVWVKARTQLRETLTEATFTQLIEDAKPSDLNMTTASFDKKKC